MPFERPPWGSDLCPVYCAATDRLFRRTALTEREGQILAMIAAGRNNQEIADHFGLTLKTVRNYVSDIFTKLQVTDRALRARDSGL